MRISESAVKQCHTGTSIASASNSLNNHQKLPQIQNCSLGSTDACMVCIRICICICIFYFFCFIFSLFTQKAYGKINQSVSIASYMCTSEIYCNISILQHSYELFSICCFTDNCNRAVARHVSLNVLFTFLFTFIMLQAQRFGMAIEVRSSK